MIRQRYELLKPFLNEKSRRLLLAAEAQLLGWGGISKVSHETGVSCITISNGISELNTAPIRDSSRQRKPGGGRRKIKVVNPSIIEALDRLVEPYTAGTPESPLRWTIKSTRRLAEQLGKQGFKISHARVADLLKEQNYSLQANRKMIEGGKHPDRNAQFEYINRTIKDFQEQGQPVISVDTKKKELIGNFKNNGCEYHEKGMPELVMVHDFEDKKLGKANPYGIYDIAQNSGWVSIGIDHDTAAFAVESIRRWWLQMGCQTYPKARKLMITADGGGSNGSRVKLWKVELQKLANEIGLDISVSHLPPGTSKWNKIEHKMFAFISQNWRGKPLTSLATIVNLIAATTTRAGLKIKCNIDFEKYPKGIRIKNAEMENLLIELSEFHGEWNYTIKAKPR